jgi:hypothetical protein
MGRGFWKIQADYYVSYHEAGHAVVGYLMGGTLGQVTAVANGHCAGVCTYTPQPPVELTADQIQAHVRRCMIVDLAGLLAEDACRQRVWRDPGARHGWQARRREVMRRLEGLTGPALSLALDTLDEAEERAPWLVRRYWWVIDALAKELFLRGTLTGDEAVAVIEQALGRKQRKAA